VASSNIHEVLSQRRWNTPRSFRGGGFDVEDRQQRESFIASDAEVRQSA